MLGIVLMATAGCTGGGDGSGTGDTPGERPSSSRPDEATAEGPRFDEDPTFTNGDCWWDVAEIGPPIEVTCGTVEVPADRQDPDSDLITLAVARMHHRTADPSADPILQLHGGPGGAALSVAPTSVTGLAALSERDLVLWDQRGSGRSEPSLNCPEKEEAALAALSEAAPFTEELRSNLDAAAACRDRLTDDGVDLDDYDTPASVADIESLRAALGVEQWNLWGGSYGTRLGLAYARQHPDRVRTLTIDSVYPTEVGGPERARTTPTEAFDRLIAACSADPACSAAHPDLGAELDRAVASLDTDPEVFTASVEADGETRERRFTITGADFRSGMFVGMYDSTLIPALPGIIADVAGGDRAVLPVYAEVGVPRIVGLSEGALFSIDCADSGRSLEGASAEDLAGDGEDALYSLVSSQLFCEIWGVEPVPEEFNEAALPDVPTLVFAGTLDPVTPYADSAGQAQALPDAQLVTVPRGGHGALSFNDCTVSAFSGFLTDPEADLPPCVADLAPLPFATPAA